MVDSKMGKKQSNIEACGENWNIVIYYVLLWPVSIERESVE